MPSVLGYFILFLSISFLFSCQQKSEKGDWVIVIHGGAGYITREGLSEESELGYRQQLEKALKAGSAILKEGGSSLDAVTAAIMLMEDAPQFNAGKGSVFNEFGKVEMDASIMNGSNLNAGAVSGVHHIKNPILAARAVMEKSDHVMLSGEGAEKFALEQGIEMVDSSYFFTKERWERYLNAKESKVRQGKHGTVGAVALDKDGNLAAGTSTGGMTFKMSGRIGDSPIIGAGTYADNESCAVSATGHGEYFIRNVVSYDLAALLKYKGWNLQKAAKFLVEEKLDAMKADGGLIAVDAEANIAMPFNTPGMFRAYQKSTGEEKIMMYKAE